MTIPVTSLPVYNNAVAIDADVVFLMSSEGLIVSSETR